MKKLLSLLLALVLTFSLVACGNKTSDTTGDKTKEDTTKTDEKKTDETTSEKPVLKYLVLASGEEIDQVEAKINERLDELKAGYNIKILTGDWGNYQERLGLAARGASAEDERFDLATTASWLGPFKTLVDEGTLLDMSKLLDEAAPQLSKSLTDGQKAGASIGGGLYGIQTVIDGAQMARDMFIWNVAELEKIGKTIDDVKGINKVEDLEPFLKLWKEKFPEKYPLNGDTWAERRLGNWIRPTADGKAEVVNILKSEGLKKQFELVKSFVDKGYLHPESGVEGTTFKNDQGDAFLVSKGEGEPGSPADWENQKGVKVYAVPLANDNILYNQNIQGKLTSVYAHTKYPKEAINFIEKVKFDEVIQNLLAFGIEGKHYNLEDGKVVPVADQKGWSPWVNQWSNDVRLSQKTGADRTTAEFKKLVEDFNKDIVPSPDLGFQPSKELQEKITLVESRGEGVMRDLQNGRLDGYDNWIKELDSVNIDNVVEELKAEFENWQKAQ